MRKLSAVSGRKGIAQYHSATWHMRSHNRWTRCASVVLRERRVSVEQKDLSVSRTHLQSSTNCVETHVRPNQLFIQVSIQVVTDTCHFCACILLNLPEVKSVTNKIAQFKNNDSFFFSAVFCWMSVNSAQFCLAQLSTMPPRRSTITLHQCMCPSRTDSDSNIWTTSNLETVRDENSFCGLWCQQSSKSVLSSDVPVLCHLVAAFIGTSIYHDMCWRTTNLHIWCSGSILQV